VAERREELAPWINLVQRADHERATFAVWQAPEKYPERRVLWRVRTLSRRAVTAVRVRDLTDLSQLAPGEWLFTRGCGRRDLAAQGFAELVRAHCEDKGWAWSAYRRMPSR
jgi:hypothetical protein